MPRQRKNKLIHCTHFDWKLYQRDGVWQADGRSNSTNAGRHSLGTKDESEARSLLSDLDRRQAERFGLAPRTSPAAHDAHHQLSLGKGRELYEEYIGRSDTLGGVAPSTQKRYRAVFNKFLPFVDQHHFKTWNQVNADVITKYTKHLEGLPTRRNPQYQPKTIRNEVTTLKQTIKWLIGAGHLTGCQPINLRVRKVESESPYCYRKAEVEAMTEFCLRQHKLIWLGQVILALATTGLRIAELAALKWSDLNLETKVLRVTDETGYVSVNKEDRHSTKNRRSRVLPIQRDLLAVLQDLNRIDAYVFHGPRGGRLKPDTVRRILVSQVLEPLAEQFPARPGEKSFRDGRLHSFRHYFCSTCANSGIPEPTVMKWLGHSDSAMVRLYYTLHDEEARRKMDQLDFVGQAAGRSSSVPEVNFEEEVAAQDPE